MLFVAVSFTPVGVRDEFLYEEFVFFLFGGFVFFNLLFLGLLALLGRLSGLRPLVLTGRMMILIALYFILILLIAPHFQEAGKLYAAARSAADEKLLSGSGLAVPAVAACALIAGFLAGRFQTKRS